MKPQGFVLAGGRAARMGVDKARLPMKSGVSLAVWMRRALVDVCGSVALIRRDEQAQNSWLNEQGAIVSVVVESSTNRHPLMGLVTALENSSSPWVGVVPCDVPLLPPQAMRALWQQRSLKAGGVVAADDERPHALIGFFHKSVLARVVQATKGGWRCDEFAEGLPRVMLPNAWLSNVNEPWQLTSEAGFMTIREERERLKVWEWVWPQRSTA